MSNEMVTRAANAVAKKDSMSNVAGDVMLYAGLGGGSLVLLAGILPFISLPMLLVALVVGGVTLKVKS